MIKLLRTCLTLAAVIAFVVQPVFAAQSVLLVTPRLLLISGLKRCPGWSQV